MATKKMNESWERVRRQIESIWSETTFEDREMKKARGNMRAMVKLIHEKTGDAPNDIFHKICAII